MSFITHVLDTNRHVECEMCNSQLHWQLQRLNTSVCSKAVSQE